MKKKVALLLVVCISLCNRGLTQSNPERQGLTGIILYADSIKVNEKALNTISRLKNEISSRNITNVDLSLKYYNLAVCYSARNNIDSTYYFLCRALSKSARYNNLIFNDTDFRSLRNETRWDLIVQKIDSAFLSDYPELGNMELAIKLYHIYLKDQHVRGLGLKTKDENINTIDQANLEHVEEIILKYGWPTYKMVGEMAAKGAFLTILHSNTQVQQKYFMLIFEAAQNSEASKEWIALLMDRISVQRKGVQVFGTQVYQIKDSHNKLGGIYRYFPIQDEAIVDSLRKAFDMIPLKDYLKSFGIDYKPPAK